MTSQITPPGAIYSLADMKCYEVTYPRCNGDPVPAYVARPAAEGEHPGVIIVHGVHGHEEHLKDVARRLAVHGYATILPALYSREEFTTVVEEEDVQKTGAWLRNRPNAQANGDLQGALDFLRASPFVNERIGVVGFCSGGRVGLVFACNTSGLECYVNFYSNGIIAPTEVNPVPPIEMVKDLCCPMLGLFGKDDPNPSPQDVAQLEAELARCGKTYEIVSYPNAAHAFFSDTRPSYRPEVCHMAWGRCLEWFSRYLKS
jgi:carboxymethylenebutenolidase